MIWWCKTGSSSLLYAALRWAISNKLRATLSGWDSTFWNLKDWYREASRTGAGSGGLSISGHRRIDPQRAADPARQFRPWRFASFQIVLGSNADALKAVTWCLPLCPH
jgi:hypothetical protein